jgi:hypothetical protein
MDQRILNGNIEKLGGIASGWIPLTPEDGTINEIKLRTEAELFEQLLLFEKLAIRVEKDNFGLAFLIQTFGYKKVRELLDRDLINFVLWTPAFFTTIGQREEDGKVDHSKILGTPPLYAGTFQPEDVDPEINLDRALNKFNIGKGSKLAFKRAARDKYVLPDNRIAVNTKDYIINAFIEGKLNGLGLVNNKRPEDLDHNERRKLVQIGGQVIETTVLAQNNYSSFEKLEPSLITQESFKKIGLALSISNNTGQILEIENIPNLRDLYISEKLSLSKILELRQKSSVKKYRKWISEISQKTDSSSITKEYINEITGKNSFFESTKGKFVKNVGLFGLGAGLGGWLGGLGGAAVGSALSSASDFGLGLLDTYLLDNLLKGWNPRLFVKEVEKLREE